MTVVSTISEFITALQRRGRIFSSEHARATLTIPLDSVWTALSYDSKSANLIFSALRALFISTVTYTVFFIADTEMAEGYTSWNEWVQLVCSSRHMCLYVCVCLCNVCGGVVCVHACVLWVYECEWVNLCSTIVFYPEWFLQSGALLKYQREFCGFKYILITTSK